MLILSIILFGMIIGVAMRDQRASSSTTQHPTQLTLR